MNPFKTSKRRAFSMPLHVRLTGSPRLGAVLFAHALTPAAQHNLSIFSLFAFFVADC